MDIPFDKMKSKIDKQENNKVLKKTLVKPDTLLVMINKGVLKYSIYFRCVRYNV